MTLIYLLFILVWQLKPVLQFKLELLPQLVLMLMPMPELQPRLMLQPELELMPMHQLRPIIEQSHQLEFELTPATQVRARPLQQLELLMPGHQLLAKLDQQPELLRLVEHLELELRQPDHL